MGGIHVNDPAPRNRALELTGQPSLGSGYALGAVAEESWLRSPFAPLRQQEMMEATAGTEMPETGPVDQPIPPLFQDQPITPRANLLTPQEANDRFGIPGELSFDQPVRAGQAQVLNRWKREELKRQNILSRSTPGVLPGAARLGVGLLVQVVDPLNVASAFIPIVREARFAQLVGRMGVTGARLTRGATEGLVGAAVVEPLVYLQAQSEQADYDAYDSLLNLAFGTALGGGLHAGFGKISDWIRGQPIELRETALRGAVAAIAEDRPVRVAEVLDPEGMVTTTTPRETPGRPANELSGNIGQLPQPEPGMVRLYHGGADPTSGGGRWVTTDEAYARGYAQHNSNDPTQVHYVDVPADAPWLKKSDYFEEDGRVFNQEVPEEIAKNLQRLPDAPPRAAVTPPQMGPRRVAPSPDRVMEAQRSTYDATPEQAAQARALEVQAEGWDQPITPEQGAEEAAEMIEATNEMVQAAKRSGDLDDRDLATIEGDPEAEKLTKGRAAAYQAASACLARVA
jgi:hypothetical protein